MDRAFLVLDNALQLNRLYRNSEIRNPLIELREPDNARKGYLRSCYRAVRWNRLLDIPAAGSLRVPLRGGAHFLEGLEEVVDPVPLHERG